MAQYKISDPEEMIECPYDKVHMIAAKRMQYHMMKCRRNHPGADFAVCPYNARHEVRKPELRYHMANCPDKARLEPSILHEQNKENREGQYFKGNTDLPCYAESSNHESVENWDEEIPSVARIGVDRNYFMRLNARSTAGMSVKEKKVYMAQVNLPAEERYVPDPEEEEEKEEQKLRLPHAKPETYMTFPGSSATHVGQIPPSTSVLALSLSRSGVGRGQVGGRGVAQVTPQGPRPVGRGQPGIGRSVGRGLVSMVTPGYTTMTTNTNTNSVLSMTDYQPEVRQPVNGQQSAVGTNGQQSAVGTNGQQSATEVNGHSTGLRLPSSMMPNVFSMGLGRGAGRGSILTQNRPSPSFVIPHVPVANSSGSEADDGNVSSSSTLSDAEKKKEKRRLEKKLRQIELLDGKVAEGYKLTSEEEIKCEKKDEILEAIQDLRI